MKLRLLPVLFVMLCGIAQAQPYGPISVNSNLYTVQQLVSDVLINGCVEVSNVSYAGVPISIGYFNATGSSFDTIMHEGIVMACGNITNMVGPNNNGAITTDLGAQGDPDLNALIPGYTTWDATVLEFDFVPSNDTLQFRYVFGSDEYLEWCFSSFNDVFGFLLSGPNPGGGNYTNLNIATVPGSSTPVSINNVNTTNNSSYYIVNGTGSSPNGESLQYDGYTVGLTAFAVVIPCQTYHIKLAVADAGDHVLDSGVFLEAGSFSDGTSVSILNVNTIGTFNDVYEGCTNFYVFTRNDTTDLSNPVAFPLEFAGTATMGVDISMFPDTFIIPAGQVSDTIFYTVFNDGVIEPTEPFIISIAAGCPCDPEPASDTITLYDYTEFKASIINTDSMFCGITPPATYTMNAVCISHPPWFVEYLWNTGETTADITVVPPPPGQADVYWCMISDLCGNFIIDSLTVGVSNLGGLGLSKTNALCYSACNGTANAQPLPLGNVPNVWYVWSNPAWGTTYSGAQTGICAGTYSLTITDSSYCYVDTTFTITQPAAALDPNSGLVNTQTNFCAPPGNITLTAWANIPNVSYSWNGAANSTSTFNVSPPVGTSYYWVKISDYCGYSIYDTAVVRVSDMSVANVNISDANCFDVCDGSANIYVPYGIPPFNYIWSSPATGTFSTASGILNNLCDAAYHVTVTDFIGCTYVDQFDIAEPEAFSLESGIITTDTLYCGTTPPATLTLETSVNIPNVNYQWNTGSASPHLSITPVTGAALYWVNIADNCGNEVTDSITVVVSNMTGLAIATDTTLCYNSCNGEVHVNPTGGVAPFTWLWNPASIGNAASGDIINICQGNYSVLVKDNVGCQYSANFSVDGPGPLSGSYISNTNIYFCGVAPPPTITLQTAVNTSGVSYEWFNGNVNTTQVVSPTVGPNYFWVTFTDLCDNTYTDTLLISVSSFTGISTSSVSTLCFGSCDGEASVTQTGGIPPFQYVWAPDSLGIPGVNQITGLCAGTYTLTVTDYAGCHYTKNVVVSSPAPLSVDFTVVNIPDPGMTGAAAAVVTGGTSPYTYQWDDADQHTTYNAPGLEMGTYHVTVMDANGCSIVDSVTILGVDVPDIDRLIQVYPNPSLNGNFNIEFGNLGYKQVRIKVYDMTGRLTREEFLPVIPRKYQLTGVPAGFSQLVLQFDDTQLITKPVVVTD